MNPTNTTAARPRWLGAIVSLLIVRPNRWYDNLPDTRRFLTFFIPFVCGQIMFGLLGGGWYVAWLASLAVGFMPWRVAYFALANAEMTDANRNAP